MANEEHLGIIKKGGTNAWNHWRDKNPEVQPDLSRVDLSGKCLCKAKLNGANLKDTKLAGANFSWAKLNNANLTGTDLSEANLLGAELKGATLYNTNLAGAVLIKTKLIEADLTDARLTYARLVETNLENAKLRNCRVYGISAWKIKGKPKEQSNLIITPPNEPTITVDNLEVAQFIYLLLNNRKIRDVIQNIGQKGVLILGRFSPPERKEVLDAIAERLRQKALLPILFDFEKSAEKDFTETIKILAGLSLFVIVDITNPKSSPLELQATVPDYAIPFVPIIQKGEEPFSMFHDLKKYPRVLDIRRYESKERLIDKLEEAIIKPAIQKHNEMIGGKAEKFKITDI